MIVVEDPGRLDASCRGGVISVGNFDGVHRGHAALLGRAAQLACGGSVIAVTFEPHPVAVLAPHRAPRRLTPLREKLSQMATLGVTATLVLPTGSALLSMEAGDFIERMLVQPLSPKWMVEGPGFGFGAGRRGNVDTLRDMGRMHGFDVEVIEPLQLTLPGQSAPIIVSSSVIRDLLANGEITSAAACLGRPYVLIGTVERGAGVGRVLGYPTMNLNCDGQQLPADGVYAGRASFNDDAATIASAVSIGRRATFDGERRLVEAHLLNTSGDYYDRTVRLELNHRLREQIKFASAAELQARIAADVQAVRDWSNG